MRTRWLPWLAAAAAIAGPSRARAGGDDDKAARGLDDTVEAAEAEAAEPAVDASHWNEIDLKLITVRVGAGVLLDWATYEQDLASEAQMPVTADEKLRDFRILLKGGFPWLPRASYSIGYMYDGATQTWRFRQTGILVKVPELDGELFVGRTKEGFSTNKIMVGYNGWTLERSAASEAFLPILADGVKWTGTGFGNRLVYNAGWFGDTLSENESFNKNDMQVAARAVWLPFARTKSETVLHLAAEFRYGKSDNGTFEFKSRPESFPAQSFAVDTGEFPASSSTMAGFEAYYRPGPLMFGSEYYLNWIASNQTGNPFFDGGEVFVSYLFTGEVRPYNEKGAYFEGVVPKRSVVDGGLGAWEAALRYSYVDLDSAQIHGGTFGRITPVISWYVSKNLRLEAEYGYSWLDRDGFVGHTQYFQSRFQFQFM